MRNIGLTMQECMRENYRRLVFELGYVIDIRWRRMDAFGICETKTSSLIVSEYMKCLKRNLSA